MNRHFSFGIIGACVIFAVALCADVITIEQGQEVTIRCVSEQQPEQPVPNPEMPPGMVIYQATREVFNAQPHAAQWGRWLDLPAGEVREWESGTVLQENLAAPDPDTVVRIYFQVDYLPVLPDRSAETKVQMILWAQDGTRWRDRLMSYGTVQVPASGTPRIRQALNWGLGSTMARAEIRGLDFSGWMRYMGVIDFSGMASARVKAIDGEWSDTESIQVGDRDFNGSRLQIVLGMPEDGKPHELPGYGWRWANLFVAVE